MVAPPPIKKGGYRADMKSNGRTPIFFTIALLIIDVTMSGLAFYIAYLMRLQSDYENISLDFSTYWGLMSVHMVCIAITFFFYRLYHRHRTPSHIDEFYSVFGAGSVGTVVSVALISFIYKDGPEWPRLMMIYTWLLTILFVTMGRVLYTRFQWALQARGVGQVRLLIIGMGDVARLIHQKIQQSPGIGYKTVGFVSDANGIENILGLPILGHINKLEEIIEANEIDEVIIGMPEAPHQQILSIVASCERERVAVKVFPDVFQIMATEVSIDDLNGLPLLSVRDVALRGWRLTVKRAMDVVISSLVLIVGSPIFLLITLLIKLDSYGPVFYYQDRMGLDGKTFPVLKFRSMPQNAEAESGPVRAKADDLRATRLGSIMRRFSLDEAPQFVNVLLGDMSMVGPRPERPHFVNQFRQSIPRYMDRHREKAGITGWAQVNGLRGDTSIIERTKYDLWYIENWSILLDIKIMLKTLVTVLFDKNAY